MKLNIGCGKDIREGWTNLDIAPGAGVDLVADCCAMPLEDESVDEISSSHMIEHLDRVQAARFVDECWRVLRPGGIIEIIAPDMERLIAEYWPRREQESIDIENFPISPLDWLDNLLFSRHLHEYDFHRHGIYESKLRVLFSKFSLHQFERRDRAESRWEIRMTCSKNAPPRCSIVLSTRNKAAALARTLKSIASQHVPFPYEVIVVDDGSTDATPAVCREYGVRYFRLDNDRYRNPSVARNVGYRAARGDVVICQSDDVIHLGSDVIARLTQELEPGTFLLAKVDNYKYGSSPPKFVAHYCGPDIRRPYFFLGSILRKDLYAAGGCDEDFVEPCFDDNWLADCLMRGLKLRPSYSGSIYGHHQAHKHPEGSHQQEHDSQKLYFAKFAEAEASGRFVSRGGPWGDDMPVPTESTPVVATTTPLRGAESGQGRVPKRMSFFWAGGKMSWMRYMTIHSFRHFHPDWTVRLALSRACGEKSWSSHEQHDGAHYSGTDYLDAAAALGVEVVTLNDPETTLSPAHASDLFQWDVLAADGGFYSDMDIIYTGTIPYESMADADAILCFSRGYAAIGFCGAKAGTPLLRDVREVARRTYSKESYQSTGAEALYEIGGVRDKWRHTNRPGDIVLGVMRERYPELSVYAAPENSVYPLSYRQMAQIFSESQPLPADSFGLHWFGGHPTAQQWNNAIGPDTVATIDNTWTRCARLSL